MGWRKGFDRVRGGGGVSDDGADVEGCNRWKGVYLILLSPVTHMLTARVCLHLCTQIQARIVYPG